MADEQEAPRRGLPDVRPLLLAIQFLSILPIPLRGGINDMLLGRAVAFFPLVGLIIGLAEVAVVLVLRAWVAPGILAALVLLTGAMITGGLHLDGLADTCDGLFVFRTTERRLEIMRDSRIGSYGVVGLVCILIVRYAALVSLLDASPDGALRAILVATVLSRWTISVALIRYPYARVNGSGSGFKTASRSELIFATGQAIIFAALAGGGWAGVALPLVVAVTMVLVRWMLGMLPGLTGDTYGAISELNETAVLVAATIILA